CNYPILSASPSSAGPGDRVGFQIINMSPGDTYVVSVNGTQVASGTASAAVVNGSFTMPDFGSAETGVSVGATVNSTDVNPETGGNRGPAPGNAVSYPPPSPAAPPSSAPTQGTGTIETKPAHSGSPAASSPSSSPPKSSSPTRPTSPRHPSSGHRGGR